MDRPEQNKRLAAQEVPNKKRPNPSRDQVFRSGQSRDRTGDLRIFSPSLYQLSYLSFWNTACCVTEFSDQPYSLIIMARHGLATAKTRGASPWKVILIGFGVRLQG